MDYGKYKYESDMKAREARRNQANAALKEIRFRLKIDTHDYETKKGHVERFLTAGDKVKVMIMFRGREQSRPEAGLRLLSKLAEEVSELGHVESSPRLDGRNMIMVLGPTKKKAAYAKGETRRLTQRTSAVDRRPAPRPAAPTPPTPTPGAPTRSSADDAQPSPAQAAARVTSPAVPAAPKPVAVPKPAAPETDSPKPVDVPKPAAPKSAIPKPMPTPLGIRPKPTPRPKAD